MDVYLHLEMPAGSIVIERDRSKIADRYKWDLTHLYPDDAAWRDAQRNLVAELPSIAAFRGKVTASPQTLLACLDLVSRLDKELSRLYCYAGMQSDLDTRNAAYLAMKQEMIAIETEFAAAASFIEPEILRLDRATVDDFIAREPRLEIYRHLLYEKLRRKVHIGSEAEEKIIADAGLMADTPTTVYSVLANADFPFAEIELSNGTPVRLTQANFALYKSSRVRQDRKKVFAAYFGRLRDFQRTFGANLYAEIKKNMFYMRARKYGSCLEHALDAANIPPTVYTSLIENVHAHLPTFHRYLTLRRRMLGVDELHYYDLYAPLVRDVDLQYTIDEAFDLVLASLAPLGEDYVHVARTCFTQRWVDVFPTEGKLSGAYSNGAAYDVHPYILLNYNGKYDDVSTIAHELGHTMHSYYSNRHQPYPTSRYSIFVAEVASTFNEALLMDYMLRTVDNDDVRLSLLGNYLDSLRGTVFRQVQFSEFELQIHRAAESGEALTGQRFSEIYDALVKRYYGHDRRICVVDDEINMEWAHIPHFYYHFYVYQYATSFTASVALSERVLAGDAAATKRYLELLSAGGSDYPIALLQNAGVDMTGPEPFQITMQKMNAVMDEIESILARKRNGAGSL